MAKENKPASMYAKPHTMTGKKVKIQPAGPADNAKNLRDTPVSVANSRDGAYKPTKTSGKIGRAHV